jgi:hypothetical protein
MPESLKKDILNNDFKHVKGSAKKVNNAVDSRPSSTVPKHNPYGMVDRHLERTTGRTRKSLFVIRLGLVTD